LGASNFYLSEAY